MRKLIFILIAVILPLSGQAGAFTVEVSDQSGAPLPNTVVMLEGAAGRPLGTKQVIWDDEMAQRDIRFMPQVLVVPVGTQVLFPNHDRVRHHVYSFSQGNEFELRLHEEEGHRSHTFMNTGIVVVGCNIHSGMMAFIRVVDTPFAKVTDANGQAVFETPATGAVKLKGWHPKAREVSDVEALANLSDGTAKLTLNMPVPGHQHAH